MVPSSPSSSVSSNESFWDGLFSSCGSWSTEEQDDELLDLLLVPDETEDENSEDSGNPLEVYQLPVSSLPLLPRPFHGFGRKPNCLEPFNAAAPVHLGPASGQFSPHISHRKDNLDNEDTENASSFTELEDSNKTIDKTTSREHEKWNHRYCGESVKAQGGCKGTRKSSEAISHVHVRQNYALFPASSVVTTIEEPNPVEIVQPPSKITQHHSNPNDVNFPPSPMMIPQLPSSLHTRAEITQQEEVIVQINFPFASRRDVMDCSNLLLHGGFSDREANGSSTVTAISDDCNNNYRNPHESIHGYSTVLTTPFNTVNAVPWSDMRFRLSPDWQLLWHHRANGHFEEFDSDAIRPPAPIYHLAADYGRILSLPAPNGKSESSRPSKHECTNTNYLTTSIKSKSPPAVVPRVIGNNHDRNSSSPQRRLTQVVPHDNDILFGRGHGVNQHPGNLRFRSFITQFRQVYLRTPVTEQKTSISQMLVGMCKAPFLYDGKWVESRFLRFDKDRKVWEEVSDEVARRKIAHLLRARETMNGNLDGIHAL